MLGLFLYSIWKVQQTLLTYRWIDPFHFSFWKMLQIKEVYWSKASLRSRVDKTRKHGKHSVTKYRTTCFKAERKKCSLRPDMAYTYIWVLQGTKKVQSFCVVTSFERCGLCLYSLCKEAAGPSNPLFAQDRWLWPKCSSNMCSWKRKTENSPMRLMQVIKEFSTSLALWKVKEGSCSCFAKSLIKTFQTAPLASKTTLVTRVCSLKLTWRLHNCHNLWGHYYESSI